MKKLLLALCIVMFCSASLSAHAQNITTSKVETTHVFNRVLPWFGQVQSSQAVSILARTNGLIVNIGSEDETPVQQGDTLFLLAGKDVEAKAMDLQQQYQQAQTEVTLAQKNLDLKQSLLAQGLTTHEQINMSKNNLALARAHRSSVKQAITSLHTGTKIMAPITGIFTARHVYIGQYTIAGTELARIVDTQHKRIKAALFPTSGATLKEMQIYIDGEPQAQQAHVTSILPETTQQGATQLWLQGPDIGKLPIGAKISGTMVQKHQGMAVPLSAIAHDDRGNTFVFVKTAQNWHKQAVETGLYDQQLVEVTKGLNGDEQLANSHAYELLYHDFSQHYQAPD